MEKSQCIPKTPDFLSYHKPLGTVLAACTALLFLLSLPILGIFIWQHHTPSSKPITASSATFCCPAWPSLSSAPSCSSGTQDPSPVLCPRQLLGSPSQPVCPPCWPRPSWWWQPSMPPSQPPGLRGGQGQFSLAPSPLSVPWSRQPCVRFGGSDGPHGL